MIVFQFSSVQSLSCIRFFATPWTVAHQASLSITNSRSLLNSCPSSRWCHPTISSSVVPFFSHFQSFPASGSFPWVSQFFTSGDQSTGVSASASVIFSSPEIVLLIKVTLPWWRKWQPTPVFLPGKSQDRGARWTTVHGVAKSLTRLSNWAQSYSVFKWEQSVKIRHIFIRKKKKKLAGRLGNELLTPAKVIARKLYFYT